MTSPPETVAPECKVNPEDCVGDTRAKWLSIPGLHHPDYFQCTRWDPQIEQLSDPDKRIHWNTSLNRVRKPLDIYRPWAFDRSGKRRMDANPSDVDCKPPVLGNFEFLSVCLDKPSPLTRYFNVMDNLNALHPRLLLEEFVYQNPDEYLKRKEEGKIACQLGCDGRVYEDPKPMNQREIMRLRFATNNYMTFDDWKDDPEDQLLHEINDSKTETKDAKKD